MNSRTRSILWFPVAVISDLLVVSGWIIMAFGLALLYCSGKLRRPSNFRDFN